MADFIDKNSGKAYKVEKAIDISASLAASSDGLIDGRKHEFIEFDKLPFRIKRGDQAKFFPGLEEGTSHGKIETGSIVRDTERKIVYVPIKKSNFQDNIIGPGSFVSTSFSTGAYTEISAAFSQKFGNIGGDVLVNYMIEENYTPTIATKTALTVGPVTASLIFRESTGVTESYPGIDSGDGVVFVAENNSTFATHTSLRFPPGNSDSILKQDVFFPTWSHAFNNHDGVSSSIIAFQSPFHRISSSTAGNQSGSVIGSGGTLTNVGTQFKHGQYQQFTFKGKVAGDSDSGSLYNFDFLQGFEVIIYSSSQQIASGTFNYHADSAASASALGGVNATSSIVYYVKNTSPGANGASGSFSGSISGSFFHADPELKTTASIGYYHVPGTSFGVGGGAFIYHVSMSNTTQRVPRIISRITI